MVNDELLAEMLDRMSARIAELERRLEALERSAAYMSTTVQMIQPIGGGYGH